MIRRAAGALVLALALHGAAWADAPHPALEEAVAASARGDREAAADALAAVLSEPRHAAAHGPAWALLGDALAARGLPEAAVIAWSEAARAGALAPSLLQAVSIVRTTGDDALLGAALAGLGAPRAPGLDLDPAAPGAGDALVMAARAAIHAGEFERAAALAERVPSASRATVDARVLRAVALANLGRHGDALAQLLIADAAVDRSDTARRDLVKLNLARTYYAAENPLRAIEHYVQVSRGGELWVHAQWERAWAHFLVDDLAGTVSLLYAFKTPWLEQRYLAEGDVLRIYALFRMCKFPTAKEELDLFAARYRPLLAALDQRLDGLSPEAAWADAALADAGLPTALPPEVWQAFAEDDRLRDARRAATAATEELARARAVERPWAALVAERLQARRDAIGAEEGARVLARARRMRDELRGMLEGADLTRLDILDYERRLLERAAVTGEIDLGDRIGELRELRRRRATRLWPGSTEMWADEVGYHSVRTRSDCREDLR